MAWIIPFYRLDFIFPLHYNLEYSLLKGGLKLIPDYSLPLKWPRPAVVTACRNHVETRRAITERQVEEAMQGMADREEVASALCLLKMAGILDVTTSRTSYGIFWYPAHLRSDGRMPNPFALRRFGQDTKTQHRSEVMEALLTAEEEQWLTVRQVAEITDLGINTVRRYLHELYDAGKADMVAQRIERNKGRGRPRLLYRASVVPVVEVESLHEVWVDWRALPADG